MSSRPAATTPAALSFNNPFEAARSKLVARLLSLPVPTPNAIGEAPDHIREAANIFDEWLYAVGSEIAESVTNTTVDMRVFSGAFLGAVDGNAAYEAQTAVESIGRRHSMKRRA